MYQGLVNELQKSKPDIPEIVQLLIKGRPENFFDKLFKGLFQSQALGIFYYSNSQGNNFFHMAATRENILSEVCRTINKHQDNILKREGASLDDLRDSLNATNNAGLTPAHIAIKTDPFSLWFFMEYKAALTTQEYSRNILTAYPNKENINLSPLECIFKDDATTKNVFRQIINNGIWGFLKLFEEEPEEIQEKFKQYLQNVTQEVEESKKIEQGNKIKVVNNGITPNAYSKLFTKYWQEILINKPELHKISRLMNILDGGNKDLLSSWMKDGFKLLERGWENEDNIDTIKEYILTNCSLLYLNKFLSTEKQTEKQYVTLEQATLEQILNSPKFNIEMLEEKANKEKKLNFYFKKLEELKNYLKKFEALKSYVEGSLNDNAVDNLESIESIESVQSEPQETSILNSKHNQTKLSKRPLKGSFMNNKENSSSAANKILESPRKIKDFSNPKPKIDIQTFAEEMFNSLSEVQNKKYSMLDTLIYFSNDEEGLFEDIFNQLIERFRQKSFEVPYKDVDNFLEEYIETLSTESFKNNEGTNAYSSACENGNDKIAKLLVKRGVELEVYSQKHTLFECALQYECEDTIRYLLPKVDFKDWYDILVGAFKYPHLETAEYYVGSSNLDLIKDTRYINIKPYPKGEYTVLNQGLFYLAILSEKLRTNLTKSSKKLQNNTIDDMKILCQIINLLVLEEKIYYGNNQYGINEQVVEVTYSLLKKIKKYTLNINTYVDMSISEENPLKKILSSLVESSQEVLSSIFQKYPRDQFEEKYQVRIDNLLKSPNEIDDTASTTSSLDISVCSMDVLELNEQKSGSLFGEDNMTDI